MKCLMTTVLSLSAVMCFAQNMFTNGGFENYTSCPTGWDQTNRIVGCTGRNDTPEYFNCSYNPGAANNGTGSVYLGAIRNGNSLTQEGINLQLTTPLVAGQQYSISLAVNYRVTVYSDPSYDYSLYRGCFGLRFAFGNGNQFGRPTVFQYEIDSDASVGNANNSYHTYNFQFTPTQSYTHLYIITAAMNGNVSTISNPNCTSAGAIAYVYSHTIDDLVIVPASGLPVSFLDFSVVDGNETTIHWKTASEERNDFFTVEKSQDGVVWQLVNKVPSLGDTDSGHEYSMEEPKNALGTWYYRLSQTDLDGSTEILSIKSLNVQENGEIRLYPNPANNFVFVEGTSDLLQDVRIVNVQGDDISELVQCTRLLETKLQLDVHELPAGIYLCRIGENVMRFTKK